MFFEFLLFIILCLIVLFFATVKFVPQSQEWTVERFGRFERALRPGLNFITPFIERIAVKISMRERVLDVPKQEVITQDNAIVRVDGVVFYKIFDSVKAAYEVTNLNEAITQLTMTNIRTVMGEMELDSMLSNRDVINAKLLSVIDEATDPWGVKVIRIEIKDITPPQDLQESMSRQMKAEREKRALILDAEGEREASIQRAEGERIAAILEAEGVKDAMILEAEANKQKAFFEAEARERQAEAEAVAIEMVNKSIAGGDSQAIQYFLQKQYIGSLRDMANGGNNKTILMPYEATKAVGSIGFLAEFAQEFLKKGKAK